MASVFTFDPNPVRLASPWPSPPGLERGATLTGGDNPPIASLAECGIKKLQAEPQEGPTEYKLHLLLRPRRSFSALSTVQHVSGSHQSKSKMSNAESKADSRLARLSPGPNPSSQSRQNRLQHLTTQLLWRLQQSSPYHSSSRSDLVVPILPQAQVNSSSPGPNKLLPGLGDSQGALYEIGVSDDGVFVGLAEDELHESLTTLRVMASSLGCKVEVLRMVLVGSCQWTEGTPQIDAASQEPHTENLWVAEALVTPSHDFHKHTIDMETPDSTVATQPAVQSVSSNFESEEIESDTEQLRISLTGSTTSGKSSLLGTLSTSTLDNGRGKSRLSLLKHRHEIVSGISSSVTPELIGYRDTSLSRRGKIISADVINYATGNVSSWSDIHCASQPGRLVFFTDSAGHPRYRRTIVRGLVSWAPHWTLCCIAAECESESSSNSGECNSSREALSHSNTGIDLSEAHLLLCLKLKLPLVVVITKLDLASRLGLRQTLTKVLSILKSSARQPAVLPTDDEEPSLQALAKADEDAVLATIDSIKTREVGLLVPIIFTSAVTGRGISKLHALLRHLPIPRVSDNDHDFYSQSKMLRPTVLFHIDDVFTMGNSPSQLNSTGCNGAHDVILSGHQRYGTLVIGDELLVGPFTSDAASFDSEKRAIHRAHSFPGQVNGNLQKLRVTRDEHRPSSGDFTLAANDVERSSTVSGWHRLQIRSIRNLRLPVRKLLSGQVGTLGITSGGLEAITDLSSTSNSRIRKGMVLMTATVGFHDHSLPLYRGFTAVFDERGAPSMVIGLLVIIYNASVRAAAKILTVRSHTEIIPHDDVGDDGDSTGVGESKSSLAREQEVTFQFMTSREWVELGTLVLIMPADGLSIGRARGADNVGVGLEGL
ncbi:hypothetical protein MMC07_009747, partial [Pseudocyphellaria aurata]|nr:hypothetical protein [Pseudocyphellaria aurata]